MLAFTYRIEPARAMHVCVCSRFRVGYQLPGLDEEAELRWHNFADTPAWYTGGHSYLRLGSSCPAAVLVLSWLAQCHKACTH